MKKKITKKELKEYISLHDRICESCDGCRPNQARCSFSEGYRRGQKELRDKLKEVIGD
jgi:hypothetical protein